LASALRARSYRTPDRPVRGRRRGLGKILTRYNEIGLEGLTDRSRRPYRHANQLPFQRDVIGERVRDKIAASKRKGIWVGGPIPLGYASVGG